MRGRQQARNAKLRLRRVDRERAPQISREPEVHHLAPVADFRARRARAVCSWRESALCAARADTMPMPPCDRASRRRAVHSPRQREHHADEHQGASRNVGVDQRLRPIRVEVDAVAAVRTVLRMEVADRPRGPRLPAGIVEPGGVSGARVAPRSHGCPTVGQQLLRRPALRRSRKRESRVLVQEVSEPAERSRRQSPLGGPGFIGRAQLIGQAEARSQGQRKHADGNPQARHGCESLR